MNWLLDVNVLLACGWASHPKHARARARMERQDRFAICTLAELGFFRVSMSPGFRASFADAKSALADITARPQARYVDGAVGIETLPALLHYSEVTDAYLVALARRHRLKLATLDADLREKPWAVGVAEDPL